MLRVAACQIQPRLVVLDKDGTLVAFEKVWHTWFALALQALAEQVPLGHPLDAALAESLGYEPLTDAWDPVGPLTIASTGEIAIIVASQLYRHRGIDWSTGLAIVQRAFALARTRLPLEAMIEPIGDVRRTLARLREAGLLLAVATTDDRAETLRGLKALGIDDCFATMVCGDDGVPLKPDPQMALEICCRLGVPPGEAIMIGDTIADLQMARRAGYAMAIGVLSGASSAALLSPYADAVLKDLNALEIVPPDGETKA